MLLGVLERLIQRAFEEVEVHGGVCGTLWLIMGLGVCMRLPACALLGRLCGRGEDISADM